MPAPSSTARSTTVSTTPQATRSLGIVIPAYTPDVPLLERYVEALQKELDPERIRIELDAPRDGVAARLRDAATVNVSTDRRGKGAAIMDGFDALDTDILAFLDADASIPPHSVADIVRPVSNGRAHLSVGSRRHPDAEIVSQNDLLRRVLGDGFAFLARRLLPVRCYDYQCGAKAIRNDVWTAVREHCHETGFAWDIELISVVHATGYDIAEVPVTWDDTPGSTVSPISTGIELGTALLAVRRRVRTLAVEHDRVRPTDQRPSDEQASR